MTTYIGGADIETTGLNQEDGHRIVEICVSVYDLDSEKKVGTFLQRIHPQRTIDAKAQAIHGISLADLAGEPEWDAVAPKVQKLLEKCDVIVAHNGEDFDMPFIALELMRVGLEVPNVEVLDTMKQARWATFNGKYPNLGELCLALDIPYEPEKAHSAEYDVDVMMQAFFEGRRQGFFKIDTENETEQQEEAA